jgi:hypothetical protein
MRRILFVFLAISVCGISHASYAHAAALASNERLAVDRVCLLSEPGDEKALVGGTICGSIVSSREGFEVLAEIRSVAEPGQWIELKFSNRKPYRWIKYEGARSLQGRISKVEFYAGKRKLTGEAFASYPIAAWRSVLASKGVTGLQTGDQGDSPDGRRYVGIDIGEKASCPRPAISPKDGEYQQAVTVTLQSKTPGTVIRYTRDGTVPTVENGQVYTARILLDKTTTITAVAFCDGMRSLCGRVGRGQGCNLRNTACSRCRAAFDSPVSSAGATSFST